MRLIVAMGPFSDRTSAPTSRGAISIDGLEFVFDPTLRAEIESVARPVIERFRCRDIGHMDIQITIDDPKSYTKPLTSTQGRKFSASSLPSVAAISLEGVGHNV